MVISHKYKFLFVEVPHTGSHSISKELIGRYGGETIIRHHANLSQFLNQANASEKKYFKFATVRNPLDYMVSDYHKFKSNHKGQYTNEDQFMRNGGFITERHLEQFRFVHDEQRSFSDYMTRFYDKTYNNWFLLGRDHFDYIMRFEKLGEEFQTVLDMIGIDDQSHLTHVNPTSGKKKKGFDEYYTDDLKELILRNFGPFMKEWGYQVPEKWKDESIPFLSTARFKFLDILVNKVSAHIELDPDAPLVRRIKKMTNIIG